MASRLLRRSGIAVGLVCENLGWVPDFVFQVGIGFYDENHEAYVLRNEYSEGHVVLKREWPDTLFMGCEPHPGILKRLLDPKSEHKYPGIICGIALSDHCGTATLHSKRRHKLGSSLKSHHERDDEIYETFRVQTETLDYAFCADDLLDGKGVLLWLDCEGSELDVLRGGERFIEHVDMVNVELTGRPPGDGWCDPSDVHWWLLDRGFLCQWKHSDRLCIGQWDGIYVRRRLFRPEFCCCPHAVRMYAEGDAQ